MAQAPLGLLMPHPPAIIEGIGHDERQIASRTVEACEQASAIVDAFAPDTVILITPHGPVFNDAVAIMATPTLAGDFSRFGVPSVRLSVPVDLALARAIIRQAQAENLPMISIDATQAQQYRIRPQLDHGALVPLWFIQKPKAPPRPIIHLTYGMLPGRTLFRIGQAIRKAAEHIGRRVVFVASGDLSHKLAASGPYGFDPAGPPFDHQVVEALTGDWGEGSHHLAELFHLPAKQLTHAAECGLRSIQTLIGFLDGDAVIGECLSYEGPFGVGYAVMVMRTASGREPRTSLLPLIEQDAGTAHADRKPEAHPYVLLARKSLETYLRKGERLKNQGDLPVSLFADPKACFVSIKKHGSLRGCIGTLEPATANLAQEIIANALSAGLRDPRFPPVAESELDDLSFSVDVLSVPEPADRSKLDPEKFGVIVRHGRRSGVLLPDLEGVDTVERQLSIALQKAGIRPDEPFTIERFTVDRYQEKES